MFTKIFNFLFGKKEPAQLDDIIGEINRKVVQLQERMDHDENQIAEKAKEQAKLEQEKEALRANHTRASRIKARFEESVK